MKCFRRRRRRRPYFPPAIAREIGRLEAECVLLRKLTPQEWAALLDIARRWDR